MEGRVKQTPADTSSSLAPTTSKPVTYFMFVGDQGNYWNLEKKMDGCVPWSAGIIIC
jgi:hypothetical protein